jgi:hypothetical protein
LEFGVSGFGFRVSGFEFSVKGFGLWIWGFVFEIESLRSRAKDRVKFQGKGVRV